jgi:O-Antigen ligase/Tetratricopeptide repeat
MARPERLVRCRPMSSARVSVGAHVLALGVGALVAGAVFFGGASGDASVPWVGGGALVLAAGALAAAGLGLLPLPRLERPAWIVVAALAGLVMWMGVSIAWSVAGDLSWSALNKGVVYLAALLLGVAVSALGTSTTRAVASLLAAVLGAALAWALIGKAIPAAAPEDALSVARLHSPVGYWNGLALLADGALVLGTWLAVTGRQRRPPVRAAGAALVYLAVLAGLLTTSRAGVLGGILAFGIWLWLGVRRAESSATAVAAGLPAALVAGWAFSRAALTDVGQPHADRVHEGAVFAVLGVAGLAIAVTVAAFIPRLVAGRERTVGRGLAVAAAVGVVAAVAAFAVAVGNPVTKVTRGFSRGECTNSAGRFVCTNNNRIRWWREAGHVWVHKPLGGAGAGTFQVARKRYRASGDPVTEPHSLPFQVLAGTGVVGGALFAAFAAAGVVALRRRLRVLEGAERTAAVALAALPGAYVLHGLVDYDADFLAVTVPVLVVLGVVLAAGRPLIRSRAGVVPALAVVTVAATAVVSLALPWLAGRTVDASYSATDAGHSTQAVNDARDARSLDPLSPEPLYALASAYQAEGELTAARDAWTRATRLQPENPQTWYQLGLFEYLWTHDLCASYQAFNHSFTLDPKSTFWTKGGAFDQAKAAVNDRDHPACGR